MTSNVLQHRHFDLRQTINFAVEPINNDDLDSERLRWRGRDDCWHYAAQFHVFLSCSGRQSYLRLILAPCASLTALATYSPDCPAQVFTYNGFPPHKLSTKWASL